MTLLDIRAAYPHLFHPNQDWFVDEIFASRELARSPWTMPTGREARMPAHGEYLPRAVALAHLYVHSPHDPIWHDYLWCADADSQGQRVYVGGVANGKGFEIHRHIHLTDRFGVAVWT